MVLFAALCLCLSVIGAAVWMGLEAASSREPERPSWADGRKAFEWSGGHGISVREGVP